MARLGERRIISVLQRCAASVCRLCFPGVKSFNFIVFSLSLTDYTGMTTPKPCRSSWKACGKVVLERAGAILEERVVSAVRSRTSEPIRTERRAGSARPRAMLRPSIDLY
jgi:hypothetical protein